MVFCRAKFCENDIFKVTAKIYLKIRFLAYFRWILFIFSIQNGQNHIEKIAFIFEFLISVKDFSDRKRYFEIKIRKFTITKKFWTFFYMVS